MNYRNEYDTCALLSTPDAHTQYVREDRTALELRGRGHFREDEPNTEACLWPIRTNVTFLEKVQEKLSKVDYDVWIWSGYHTIE